MIRVGRYDAFDKWEILRRHWEDRRSIPDVGLNRLERPSLSEWHQAALYGGTRACTDYIWARASSEARYREMPLADGGAEAGDVMRAELLRLLDDIGYSELQSRIRLFAEAIAAPRRDAATHGFSPEFANRIREVFKAGALRGLQWTNERGEVPSIDILREQTSVSFPRQAISNKSRVLSLFSALFYGRSDVINIYDTYPEHVTLVDHDKAALEEMRLIYPSHWSYVPQDYEAFLREAAASGLSYDVIVCDPFKSHGAALAWDMLPIIMQLCVDTFITNYFNEMFEALGVAANDLPSLSRAIVARTGIDVDVIETLHRSSEVHWVVIRKVNPLISSAAA